MTLAGLTYCLVVAHAGPAGHFNAFAHHLQNQGAEVKVYASCDAYGKFSDLERNVFDPEKLETVLSACNGVSGVITDVGHAYAEGFLHRLKEDYPLVERIAYYDNFEPFVPGGYSDTAAKVIAVADRVMFASTKHVYGDIYDRSGSAIDLPAEKRVGIGYYPFERVAALREKKRKERDLIRGRIFKQFTQNKLVALFGGNNTTYFNEAVPELLSLLSQLIKETNLSKYTIVLQQHPGAKAQNVDKKSFELWNTSNRTNPNAPTILVSEVNSDEMMCAMDTAIYSQTTMAPLFVLLGTPTGQLTKGVSQDILATSSLVSQIALAEQLESLLQTTIDDSDEVPDEFIKEGLGVTDDWKTNFTTALKQT